MNELIVNPESVFKEILHDFSSLWSYTVRGETLEIFTPFSTMLGSIISVFLTKRDNRFIVSDGKCVYKSLSNYELLDNNKNETYLNETARHYGVKKTENDKNGHCFYFKSTTDLKLLSAYIYDLVFFETAVLNSIFSSQAFFQSEDPQSHRFSTRINRLLSEHMSNNLYQNNLFGFERNRIYQDLRFNIVLRKEGSNHLWVAMCISGSTTGHFSDHLCRASMGFGYINNQPELKRYAHCSLIFDREAKGYDLKNQTVMAAKRQVTEYFHPQEYGYDELKNISNLDLLIQNGEIVA